MRVAVKGHGYAGVPKEVLDQFRVHAAPQKQRGAGVPEVVPANRGEVCGAWNIIATVTLYQGTNLSKLLQFSSGSWTKEIRRPSL